MEGKSLGEFSLIDNIRSEFSGLVRGDGVLGIGDDCAIIPQASGKDTLVSTDLLVEGVHFILPGEPEATTVTGISAYELGWKSAAVNISDIAGMGGKPTATFLSIAIPARIRSLKARRFNQNCSNLLVPWLEEFLHGYKDISAKYGVALLGGDTTSSLDKLCINVTVLGECEYGKAVRRSAAQAGDLICVTGNLGDSAAGLKLLLKNIDNDCRQSLLRKHFMPEPKVSEGQALAKLEGIGAMMDISDGIASDLKHILEESNACIMKSRGLVQDEQTAESQLAIAQTLKSQKQNLIAIVDVNKLPMSDCLLQTCKENGWDPIELAVGGGEDYELLFTCRPDAQIPIDHYVIGEIIGQSSTTSQIIWKGTDKDFSGFNHFLKIT